ncbi:MAG: coenzyme F420-0:L-glutamate ligase [Anaerolineae bacterium]|nr:MAG: coenzyme F420-0:L-glutamate ligase [Anaerolineae bacterium]
MQMTLTALPGIPLIRPGDDLAGLILASAEESGIELETGDVLAVAQKVVSKAENRLVDLGQIQPSEPALKLAEEAQKDPRLVEVILSESNEVLRVRPGLIIVEHRLGFVCANAGVDHSNVEGRRTVLLLPENPEQSAGEIRESLERVTGASLGVLIIDSHGRAWRMGTEGVAIGASGFPALLDLRGEPDLFGRTLEVTQVGLADEMAAAASLVMGQGDEERPVIHVRGFPYPLREGSVQELLRPKEIDLFR